MPGTWSPVSRVRCRATGLMRVRGRRFRRASWPTPTGCWRRRGQHRLTVRRTAPCGAGSRTRSSSRVNWLLQNVERADEGGHLKQGVEQDRIVSVHDPEMRHGRKSRSQRFDGHKASVAVEPESQLITAVGGAVWQCPGCARCSGAGRAE